MKQIFFTLLCLFAFSASLYAQPADFLTQPADTLITQIDSIQNQPVPGSVDTVKQVVLQKNIFTSKNKLLNIDATPVSFAVQLKKVKSKETLFYLITGIVLLLAFLKYFYNRYFTNLFRVFFNSSLRQSQLTDQLLQAKLQSLLFNLFFVISSGVYVSILLVYYQLFPAETNWALVLPCAILIGLIYLLKFSTLKFTGWVTGLNEVTDTYIFVTFLINKIIGIFLVPFIIIMAFADPGVVKATAVISMMSIAIFLLLRFFRSYGLLQNHLKISRAHFFLYLAGVELLPLLLVYKGLMFFLSKNI